MKKDKHITNEANWVRVIIFLWLVVSLAAIVRWRMDREEYLNSREKEVKRLYELERVETTPTMDGSSFIKDSIENLGVSYPFKLAD